MIHFLEVRFVRQRCFIIVYVVDSHKVFHAAIMYNNGGVVKLLKATIWKPAPPLNFLCVYEKNPCLMGLKQGQ